MIKRVTAWVLALVALVGVGVGYCGIFVMLAYFAAGLVWWAALALFYSGPVGATAAGLALIQPRQRIVVAIGLLAFAAWLVLWILMFTVFGFRVGT